MPEEDIIIRIQAIDEATGVIDKAAASIRGLGAETNNFLGVWRKDLKVFDNMFERTSGQVFAFQDLGSALKVAGVSMKDWTAYSKQNFLMNQEGVGIVSRLTGQTMSYGQAAQNAVYQGRRFKMEWLSIMFTGMALDRVFGGMVKQVTDNLGWTEIWAAVLQEVLLPVLLPLTDVLVMVYDWISNLTDEQKQWIGSLIIGAAVVGTIMTALGMFMLFVNQLSELLGNLIPEDALNNIEIFGFSLGQLPSSIMNSIIAMISLIGTIGGAGGLINLFSSLISGTEATGNVFQGLGEAVNSIIPGFGDLIDEIGNVFNVIKLIMTGKWTEAWDAVKGMIQPAIDWIKPKIIESLKWIWDEIKKVLPPWMTDAISNGWTAMTTWIQEISQAKSLGDAILATVKLITTWGAIGVYIATSIIDSLKTWLDIPENAKKISDGLYSAVQLISSWAKIGVYIATQMVQAIAENLPKLLEAWLKGLGNLFHITSSGKVELESFQTGGIIPETGAYLLHGGERVIPRNQAGSGQNIIVTFSPNINANISNSYDVRQLANELNKYWAQDFQKTMRSRGSI